MLKLCRKKIFNHLQHFIHLNLAVALLIGLVLFVSAIETVSDSRVRNLFYIYIYTLTYVRTYTVIDNFELLS